MPSAIARAFTVGAMLELDQSPVPSDRADRDRPQLRMRPARRRSMSGTPRSRAKRHGRGPGAWRPPLRCAECVTDATRPQLVTPALAKPGCSALRIDNKRCEVLL